MDWMPQAIREGIFTILFISGPLVILAAGLGLTIGIIQAATQVQEQTLASAVKVIGLLLALIIFGFYMFQYVSKYAADNMKRAFKLVPSLGSYVLPRENFLEKPKEEDVMDPQRPPTTLADPMQTGSGASKVGDIKSEPDQITTQRPNNPNDILATARPNTQNQARKPQQTPMQSQSVRPVTQIGVTPQRPVQQPVAQQIQRPAAQQTTPQRPAQTTQTQRPAQQAQRPANPPVQQRPATIQTPTTPARSSLSDRLNNLRGSVNEVNKELQEVGQ